MTMGRRLGRARLLLRSGALVLGLSLLMSSCYTAVARDHRAASPDTRPYFCNGAGDGTPIGGHGNGNHVHPIYEGMTKGPLSWDDCLQLGRELDQVIAGLWGLSTRSAAEAAGWRDVAGYIPGLGTHHSKELIPGLTPRPFDPTKPDFLIYGGAAPDAPLVGLGYAAPGSSNPPAAFAGTNDWWHLHQRICFKPGQGVLAGGEEIPEEECTALGGRLFTLPGGGVWLLHVWIAPNYQLKLDVFMSGYPCLGETGPQPREDPCWEIVNRDPALGPPPGHGHDD